MMSINVCYMMKGGLLICIKYGKELLQDSHATWRTVKTVKFAQVWEKLENQKNE